MVSVGNYAKHIGTFGLTVNRNSSVKTMNNTSTRFDSVFWTLSFNFSVVFHSIINKALITA